MPALRPLILSLLLGLACATSASAQVTTFGNADGTLRLPQALAVAPDGTVFVGDHYSGRIQAFRDGRPSAGGFGLRGEVCGQFGAIGGLARAADGRFFVLDSDNQRVHVFGADGRVQRCFGRQGIGLGQFRIGSGAYAASSASGGIAVAGRFVYVADTNGNRVQRFTLDGRSPKVIGRGRLNGPQGLYVRDGRLLVADDRNHRVVEFTTSGRFVRAATSGLKFPYDVVVDARGRTYVADNNGHRIVVLDRRLRRVRAWGSFGTGPGKLIYPRAIALAPSGNVLVADPGNDRVTEYTATGRYVRTLGRNGRRAGSVSTPFDVAVSPRGEVAVADGNMRISWFTTGGRWLGAWAQGKSFQTSSAVVVSPRSLAFAGEGTLRVADGGDVRDLGGGRIVDFTPHTDLLRRLRDENGQYRALTVDPASGATWLLTGTGRLRRAGADGKAGPVVGDEDPRDRVASDVAVLRDGTLVVPEAHADDRDDPQDGIVRRYDAAGKRIGTWPFPRPAGGLPSKPAGAVSDGAGGVWIADAANGRIVHLGADGAVLGTLGSPGVAVGELSRPLGITVDCEGALLVAESGNNRISRFAGVVPGAPGCAPAPTRPTAAAKLPGPVGLELKTTRRPSTPGRVLGEFRASCARTCTRRVQITGSVFSTGLPRTLTFRSQVRGARIVVTATAAQVRQIRAALRRPRGAASVGVSVEATSPDGIRDYDTVVVSFR